jgi:hypothetical protein
MSDHKGAGLLIDALPPARALIADRGYDSNGFRATLEDLGITPCIPPRGKIASSPIRMIRPSIDSATQSRTSSPSSKTGDASLPDTTGAPTSSGRRHTFRYRHLLAQQMSPDPR